MSRNAELRERFLAGEHLTSEQVQAEYGGSRSGLSWARRTMAKEGYRFKSKPLGGNAMEYWLDLKKSKTAEREPEPEESEQEQELDLTDDRLPVVKIRERFEAGEGLVAAEIGEEYNVHPNTLSIAIAQLTREGYIFDHSKERTVDTNGTPRTLKRHRVVAKHEPMPHGSSSNNGRKKKSAAGFRIPAPQVDVLTEVILVHRLGDGEIQVGLMQNGHQWLLEVKSYVE